jgi:uncharacterized repeat protein (TIGR01451 family)
MPRQRGCWPGRRARVAPTPPQPAQHASTPVAGRLPAGVPGLSISVTDGRTTAAPGDRLTSTVKIHNIGATSAPHLKITQLLPAGLTFISARSRAMAAAGKVAWNTGLAAGRAATFSVTGQVGKTPKTVLRLATVACAAGAHSSKPLVRAAHCGQLPAGAIAGRQAAARGAAWRPYGLAGAFLLLLAGAVAALAARRMRARRSAGTGRAS